VLLETRNDDVVIRSNRIAGIKGLGIGPHAAGLLFGRGILASGSGAGLLIAGNTIGLDATGAPVLGSVTGIDLGDPVTHKLTMTGVVVGGALTRDGNEVAGHVLNGILVGRDTQGVRLSGNSVHDNGALGIDLVANAISGYGVTANDPLDADTGGNGLQNYPLLSSANSDGATVQIAGTLSSSPSASFRLEFFSSALCDPTGFGEGERYLGSTLVMTNTGGNASFNVSLWAPVAPGAFVSSTATLVASGSTSEFSACSAVVPGANAWTTLGQGIAGTSGVPQLVGSGSLVPAAPIQWTLSNALGNAPAWFVVGLSQIALPIVGGVLVPSPDLLFPQTTSGAGSASLSPALLQPLPSGQQVTVQVWLIDPAGFAGWAASNAIAASAP
jgi:hypothetical protein